MDIKQFGLSTSLLEAVKKCMSKEELHPNQKKLDVNKNGKLDSADFKKLRGEAKMDKEEDDEDENEKEDDENEDDEDEKESNSSSKSSKKEIKATEGYVSNAQRKAVWASRNDAKMKKEEVQVDEASYTGKGNNKPGWMLKADPALAKKLKQKQDIHKARVKSYGNPAAGVSSKADVNEAAWGKDKVANLKAALARHSEKAITANKAGDDAATKVHQSKMNVIKNKMAKMAKEEVQIDENLSKVPTDKLKKVWNSHKDEQRPSPAFAQHLKKITAELKKRKVNEEVKLNELVDPAVMYKKVSNTEKQKLAAMKSMDKTADYEKQRLAKAKNLLNNQRNEAFDTAKPKSYNVTVHHKTRDGETGKADYTVTKANDTRHAKNIAMIRHQKTLASKGVKYSSMHTDSQGAKKLDEAFPTVADAKKRMANAEKIKHDKKVTPTGTVYTKKYKEDEKEKNEMYEGMPSLPAIGIAAGKHLAKMVMAKQIKKNNK